MTIWATLTWCWCWCWQEDAGGGAMAAEVEDVSEAHKPKGGKHNARTYLGFNEYNYLGRESEGNRFIGNTEL